ncbi:MAG: rhomboid family intramembrane serine protease [Saprospiraceae bacterium]
MFNLAIIGLTCLVSFLCFNDRERFYKLAHIPALVERNKEYVRLLTAGFVHADVMHLFLNMFVLYSFGEIAEQIFRSEFMFGADKGGLMYLLFYMSAIVVANVPTFLKHRHHSSYVGVGASGATAAVIYACILFMPLGKIYIFLALPVPAWLFGILYLIYESYAAKNVNDNIGHDVHFNGALYGILFITAVQPDVLVSCIEKIQFALSSGSFF